MKKIPLSAALAAKIQAQIIEATGGAPGLRDPSLLAAALESAGQRYEGTELYPVFADKAARVCWSIIENHPFADGNDRVAIHLLLLLLSLADEELRYTQDELVDLGYGLADGSLDFGYLRIWIKTHKI